MFWGFFLKVNILVYYRLISYEEISSFDGILTTIVLKKHSMTAIVSFLLNCRQREKWHGIIFQFSKSIFTVLIETGECLILLQLFPERTEALVYLSQ